MADCLNYSKVVCLYVFLVLLLSHLHVRELLLITFGNYVELMRMMLIGSGQRDKNLTSLDHCGILFITPVCLFCLSPLNRSSYPCWSKCFTFNIDDLELWEPSKGPLFSNIPGTECELLRHWVCATGPMSRDASEQPVRHSWAGCSPWFWLAASAVALRASMCLSYCSSLSYFLQFLKSNSSTLCHRKGDMNLRMSNHHKSEEKPYFRHEGWNKSEWTHFKLSHLGMSIIFLEWGDSWREKKMLSQFN